MKWAIFVSAVALVGCDVPPTPNPPNAEPPAIPKRVQELLARLDDDPDKLHFDYTPAVNGLIEIGEPSIEPTLPYLLAEGEATRLHAERVIHTVLAKMHGFVPGQGWSRPDGEQTFRRFSKTLWDAEAMGNRSVHESPVQDRQAYIGRVKRWLASRQA